MKELILKILKSKVLFAFVLNAVFLTVCVIFTSFTYEGTADFYNSQQICKMHVYTNASVNYILAMLIGTAQYAFPGINCFVMFEVMASFAAFTSITFVFADKYNKRKAFVFSAILNIMFALHHYTNVDSTRTAAVLCAAGFLLVLLAIFKKRYTLSCWIGVVEIVFGSFLNIAYFFVSLGFAIAFFFGDMIAKKKYRLQFQKLFWYFRPFLLMFILVALVTLGLHQFSYSVNHGNEQARTFYEYSTARNAVDSLPYPNYSEHQGALADAGIKSEADFELLKNNYYDAQNGLDADSLRAVHKIQLDENPRNPVTITAGVFESVYDEFTHLNRSIMVIGIFIALSAVFIVYHKSRFSFFPLFYLIVAFISNFFLRYLYSSSENLTYGIWLLTIAMLLNSFNFEVLRRQKPSTKLRLNNGYMIISCAIIALIAVANGFIYVYNHSENVEENDAGFLITELNRNPDRYYVMDPVTKEDFITNTENYIHPMWGFRDDYLENLDDFGFFHHDETLRRRQHSENIYEAVVKGRKVYVIDNGIVFKKETYFSEHYAGEGKRVAYELNSEPEGYRIYQVSPVI